MKQSVRIGLILVVLSALLVASASGTTFALECMSTVGDVGTQCGCGGTAGCSYP